MKFDYCIGNPPYQEGRNQIYASFFEVSKTVANVSELIFPTGWQEPKDVNGLSIVNKPEVKQDKQIVFIRNKEDAFPGINGAKYTNVVMWKRGYNNGLDGKQRLIDFDGEEKIVYLKTDKSEIDKPALIVSIVDKVNRLKEHKIVDMVSAGKPYGFRADPLDNPAKYGLVLYNEPIYNGVRLFGRKKGEGRTSRYIDRNLLVKESPLLEKYKLFLVKAWGNMDEKGGYLGGSYSQLIVAEPLDCCSEMYIEVGPFTDRQEAENAKKYFNTKFFRAVFYIDKYSQNTARDTYKSVPIQDFTSNSDIDWSQSIADIDRQLYIKYGLTDVEIAFVEEHIKEM